MQRCSVKWLWECHNIIICDPSTTYVSRSNNKLTWDNCWKLKCVNALYFPWYLTYLKWARSQYPYDILYNVHFAFSIWKLPTYHKSLSSVVPIFMRPLLNLLGKCAILCMWVLPLSSHYEIMCSDIYFPH